MDKTVTYSLTVPATPLPTLVEVAVFPQIVPALPGVERNWYGGRSVLPAVPVIVPAPVVLPLEGARPI